MKICWKKKYLAKKSFNIGQLRKITRFDKRPCCVSLDIRILNCMIVRRSASEFILKILAAQNSQTPSEKNILITHLHGATVRRLGVMQGKKRGRKGGGGGNNSNWGRLLCHRH